MRSWHRCRCGLLFCIAATLLLLGPVKHAFEAAGNGVGVTNRTLAANPSDGGETSGGGDRLIGTQRDQMLLTGEGGENDLFILAGSWRPILLQAISLAPLPFLIEPRSETANQGNGSPRSPPLPQHALPQS